MPTIDDSVVRLTLDDSQFDKASDKTIKKLDELKASLDFDGSVEGFKEIERAARETDLSPLQKGAEAVSLQFNALYTIADATFRRIINGGVDMAERTLKSLTIDNVTAGWSKYADKTSAVQTIMAATAKQFDDTAVQMEYVEGQLEKLNWFTDETSYSFLDMVNNIGKFTSNNISLEDSVTAMQGISTWAAISGANVNEAGRAMYNLSQAMATGALKLQDWMSIENANMGTAQFKEIAIQAGVTLGTVRDLGNGIYQTLKGTELSVSNFRETLSEGWLSGDVLMETLNQYGEFTNVLYEFSSAASELGHELSATTILGYLEDYQNGLFDIDEAMEETGMTSEDLIKWFDRLSSSELELGNRAFRAAQEAKTFQEAIDATKEAVASGWMQSFEYIFGNYQEAKEIWSELAEGLYDVFVESGNMRNGLLRDWKALGGRTYLIDGVRTILSRLASAVEFVKETFEEIFPPKTAEELVIMTAGFQQLVESMAPSENTIEAIGNALTLLFKIFQKMGQVAIVVIAGLEPIWELIGQIAGAIIGLIGDISALLGFSLDEIFSADALTNFYNILYAISTVVATIARGGIMVILTALAGIVGFVNDIFTTYKANGGGLVGFIKAVVTNFQALFNRLKTGSSTINLIFNSLINTVKNLFDYISNGDSIFSAMFNAAKSAFQEVKTFIESVFSGEGDDENPIVNFFKGAGEAVEKSGLVDNLKAAAGVILNFVANMFGFVADLDTIAGNLKVAVGFIGTQIRTLWNWLTKELEGLTLRDVTDILLLMILANFITALTGLMKSLKLVTNSFKNIGTAFTNVLNSFSNVLNNRSGNGAIAFLDSLSKLAVNTKYLQIGAAFVMLTNSLVVLADLPTDRLGVAIAAVVSVLGFLTLLEKSIGTTVIKTKKKTFETAASNVLKMAVSIGVLTAALSVLSNSILYGATTEGSNGETSMDWNKEIGALVASIVSIGVLMLEIAGLVKLINMINPGKEFAKAAAGMTAMGVGILELSVAVAFLTLLDVTKMMSAASAIGILMISFGAMAAMMANIKVSSILAGAASMTLMALAINGLIVPIFVLSQLLKDEGNNLNDAFNAVIDLILVMGVVTTLIGKLGGGAAGSLTLATAAVAMTSFAGAVSIMAAAMQLFNNVNPEAFAKGMELIIFSFAGFAVVSIIAQAASTGLLALSLVFVSVAASFALFALAVKIIADAAAEFAIITALFIELGDRLGEEFPAKLHAAMQNVELIVREFLGMIANLAGDISAAAFTVILALKYGFLKALPDILNALLIIIVAVCEVIAQLAPPVLDAITRAIRGLIPGIPDLLAAAADFIEEFFAGLGDILHGALVGLIRGVVTAVLGRKVGDLVGDWLHELGGDTVKEYAGGVNDASGEAEAAGREIGKQTAKGLKNGVKSGSDELYNVGYDAINTTARGMKDAGEIHSPSGLTFDLGQFLGQGLIDGVSDMFPDFESTGFAAMTEHFSGMLTGAQEGGEKVGDWLENFLQMMGYKTGLAEDMINNLKNAAESGDSNAEAAGKEDGSAYGMGFEEGIANTLGSASGSAGGASKTVKTAAESIIDSYKDALEELDYLDKKYKAEYDLWEILNIDVSEIDKKTAKLELTNKEIETQIERTRIAEEKYEKIAKAMGKTSSEARDAEVEWINQQVTLAKLQNEIVELQNEIIEDASKQMELNQKNAEATYNLWVSTNKNAGKVEQEQKKLEYTMQKLEYTSNKVAEATEKYNEALEKYGEESVETKEALNELLTTQKDYADLSNEVNDIQESIVDLGKQQAELALENKTLEYEMWLETNKRASQAEKEARKTEEILGRYEAKMASLTEATQEYREACEKFGEESLEATKAYKQMLEAQRDANDAYSELRDNEVSHLEYLTEQLSISLNKAELEEELWSTTNENATELEKHAHNRVSIIRKQVYAQQELLILEQQYQKVLMEQGAESENTANAYAEILSKQIEIAEYTNQLKDSEMELLQIEEKNLQYEQTRLSVSDSYWQAANKNASVAEQSAHSIEKMNYQMVLAMKELNNLSEQYNRQIERYGQNSEEARSAWEAYRNKQVEILELQNERKALELEIIENELAMTSLVEKRAKAEYDLWEALNQDASESEKKTKNLNYQMKTLELATEKLRQASKKYNYALQMYGEEAKETQQLFNDMLDAQLEYANTYNELKSVQQEIITKNNDILEQLNYSEQLISYGYNMWEKLYDDISDAQKIEAEIKKLGMDLTTQVARANYYGAEWKRAVAKYGEGSAEAQQAYLDYLEALYKAVDLQSSIEQKEKDLVAKREEDAQRIQEVWDEITAKDLVGGTSIYDELVEMGLSEAEIEAYVREKAGVIEDTIDAEMDFSIDHMQSKAEESLREWGMTWMDGVYTVADDVVTSAGNCMADMTDIIDQGAQDGIEAALTAMNDIDRIAQEGGENTTKTVDTGIDSVVASIEAGSSDITGATADVISDATTTGVRMAYQLSAQIGFSLMDGLEEGIWRGRSGVINAMVDVVEDAIWAARREAEIFSPSHVTSWMGTMLDAGFVEGIEKDAGDMALAMARMVQNGIDELNKIVHTSNTFEYAGRMIADGIAGGFDNYSYNVLSIGMDTLNSLLNEYDSMIDEAAGESLWLLDALREYGFDETTHGIEFVVNLNADDAREELESLFEKRESDLDYYDRLLQLQEQNAAKNQSDLSVRAEGQAIERELNRIISSIEASEKAIEDFVSAGRSLNEDDTIYGKKLEYVQNIYSSKPLSALDIYRNTNSQLLKFTAWR